MRSQAFWAEQAFMDELAPTGDDSKRFYRTAHDNLVGSLTEADRPWLETAALRTGVDRHGARSRFMS